MDYTQEGEEIPEPPKESSGSGKLLFAAAAIVVLLGILFVAIKW
ncbi:MAG: hypothetical protein ABIT47_02045 [Candidatus Paceibacterota bacterium]